MSHLPWHHSYIPATIAPQIQPSNFTIQNDPSTHNDVFLYWDAKHWFALMDDYEALFASQGDYDPWRTPFLDVRLTSFLSYTVEKRSYLYLPYPAAVERIYKLEMDLLDAAFFNIERSRRDGEVVLDNNLRAILRSHADELLRDVGWYRNGGRRGGRVSGRKRKREEEGEQVGTVG